MPINATNSPHYSFSHPVMGQRAKRLFAFMGSGDFPSGPLPASQHYVLTEGLALLRRLVPRCADRIFLNYFKFKNGLID